MSNIDLSFIIPAYNAEKYIQECLDSFRTFSMLKCEIIVINDGSSDCTEEIVHKQSQIDNRINLLSISNGGVSRARNFGIENATGKYIMFIDSDDFLISEAFSVLQQLINNDNVEFAAFSREILEENGKRWTDSFAFSTEDTTNKRDLDKIMFTDSHFNECWGKLYKREIIDKYNIEFPNDMPIGEDLLFVMEYYSHCQKVYASNKPLVAYRQHGESAMRKYSITDRLIYTQDIFYNTEKYLPSELRKDYWFYYFKVLTNLCREYSNHISVKTIKKIYMSELESKVINNINFKTVPAYRIHEYLLMKYRLIIISAIYYKIKNSLH